MSSPVHVAAALAASMGLLSGPSLQPGQVQRTHASAWAEGAAARLGLGEEGGPGRKPGLEGTPEPQRGTGIGESRWMLWGFAGKSQLFLGSEDTRLIAGAALEYIVPSDRVRFKSRKGELVLEGYYNHSYSRGASGVGPNKTSTYGVLALARYKGTVQGQVGWFLDIGLGLQYADMRTVDLSGRLSSTPTLGAGFRFLSADQEVLLGARMMHVSNAGLAGNNQGQNQLVVTLGFRF